LEVPNLASVGSPPLPGNNVALAPTDLASVERTMAS
jgi:hypothetical protein